MIALLLALSSFAIEPTETDPSAIMAAVEDRDTGDKMSNRMSITIIDKAGRQRQRTVASQSMDFEGGRKQLMLFESPADVRNAGLLSVDYDDGDKADDQWLYLPSLGKSTRISSSDKSGSFMGTDLTYSDMTSKDPSEYDYTLIEASVKVGDDDCWLIEAKPKTDDEARETGYLKTQVWVSKDKLLAVQIKAWVTAGKKLKYTKFEDIRQVDGFWVPHKILVRTVQSGDVVSQSIVQMSDVRFGADMTDDDFTQRRLEQGL